GVVEDFHFASLHSPVIPLVITLDDSRSRVSFRVGTDDIAGVLSLIETKWTEFAGNMPFEYRFLDDDFALYYASEQRLAGIVTAFSSLAVIIGCMGLVGLASFMAGQRTREIGVRKVLGASTGSIVLMLLKEFSRWIVIANVIAIPAAWLLMDRWLQNFAYRTDIGPGIFVAASALTLAVALLSVIWQVGRAASSNPVRSLKYE
ncbi:MAG TPA: FtsX-like permease family protein, partial [Candidatus Krumholzibacterium sp.]|nr:FtsX-like permease family protein [Candidatus Krumholzibacterium sp.]